MKKVFFEVTEYDRENLKLFLTEAEKQSKLDKIFASINETEAFQERKQQRKMNIQVAILMFLILAMVLIMAFSGFIASKEIEFRSNVPISVDIR